MSIEYDKLQFVDLLTDSDKLKFVEHSQCNNAQSYIFARSAEQRIRWGRNSVCVAARD